MRVFLIALTIFDVLALALGAWLLWRGRRPLRWSSDVIVLSVYGVALLAVSFPMTRWLTGSDFASFRVWCSILFCVLAPLMMVRGVDHLRTRRHGPRGRGCLGFGVLVVVLAVGMESVYAYAHYVAPYDLRVRRYRVVSERLAGLARPLRILVLADLETDHIGPYEVSVFEQIEQERPDLILLAGDYLQDIADPARLAEERRELVQLFAGMRHRPRLGILGVHGDREDAQATFANTDIRLLEDEHAVLPAWSKLRVLGLSPLQSRERLTDSQRAGIVAFEGLTIVLGHSPDFARSLFSGQDDYPALLVAGHTHGGQIVIPGFGPPVTMSELPRDVAAGGLFRLGRASLMISRGVGLERGYAPRVRLFCPPELVVIELRPPASS